MKMFNQYVQGLLSNNVDYDQKDDKTYGLQEQGLEGAIQEYQDEARTVSYTHLDVYKRQEF